MNVTAPRPRESNHADNNDNRIAAKNEMSRAIRTSGPSQRRNGAGRYVVSNPYMCVAWPVTGSVHTARPCVTRQASAVIADSHGVIGQGRLARNPAAQQAMIR